MLYINLMESFSRQGHMRAMWEPQKWRAFFSAPEIGIQAGVPTSNTQEFLHHVYLKIFRVQMCYALVLLYDAYCVFWMFSGLQIWAQVKRSWHMHSCNQRLVGFLHHVMQRTVAQSMPRGIRVDPFFFGYSPVYPRVT